MSRIRFGCSGAGYIFQGGVHGSVAPSRALRVQVEALTAAMIARSGSLRGASAVAAVCVAASARASARSAYH